MPALISSEGVDRPEETQADPGVLRANPEVLRADPGVLRADPEVLRADSQVENLAYSSVVRPESWSTEPQADQPCALMAPQPCLVG